MSKSLRYLCAYVYVRNCVNISKFISSLYNRTIVSLSIVYTIGQAVMSVSSINDLTDHNRDGSPDNVSVHM